MKNAEKMAVKVMAEFWQTTPPLRMFVISDAFNVLIEEKAKLKKHAEALAEYITDKHCSGVNCESCKLVNAYRADFPKEAP